MNKDVFISHSSADQAQVEEIRRYLERYGIRCWVSYKNLSPGENFMEKCREAINTCPIFLLISDWNSIYIPLELAIALSVSRITK